MYSVALKLLEILAIRLITHLLEKNRTTDQAPKVMSDEERLEKMKRAYKEAFDGTPVTKEQRKKLNEAISIFIRNDDGGL